MSTDTFTTFDDSIRKSSEVFDLLSEPNRLGVFAILTYGEFPVTQIQRCLSLPQNLVSHHLKVLREKGFVKAKRRGRKIYYSLDQAMLRKFKTSFDRITRPLNN